MIIQFINLFLLTEDISFLLSKLIKQKDNSKIYFDYLHTLYFSLHKNYYKGEIIPEFTLNHISPQKKINIIIINIITNIEIVFKYRK